MEMLELKKDKVYLDLKQDIISGRLPSGGKLPRETELARELGVDRKIRDVKTGAGCGGTYQRQHRDRVGNRMRN